MHGAALVRVGLVVGRLHGLEDGLLEALVVLKHASAAAMVRGALLVDGAEHGVEQLHGPPSLLGTVDNLVEKVKVRLGVAPEEDLGVARVELILNQCPRNKRELHNALELRRVGY